MTPATKSASLPLASNPLIEAHRVNARAIVSAQTLQAEVEDTKVAVANGEQENVAAAQRALRDRALSVSDPTSGDPSTAKAAVVHDAEIVNRDVALYDQNKPIPKEDVNQLMIPEVRQDLTYVLNAQTINQKLAKRQVQLQDQIDGLLKVASIALQRSQDMETANGDNAPSLLPAHSSSSKERTPSTIAVAQPGVDDIKSTSTEKFSEETSSNEKVAQILAQLKTVKSPDLRERLRKNLLAARAAKAADDAKASALKSGTNGDLFEGKLTATGAATAGDSASNAGTSLAAQVVSSALQSSSEQQRFSLAGADTDAAVQKLMQDPTREISSASGAAYAGADASVLAANSLSLFERVRAAHSNCLRQKCVQAN